MASIRFMFTTIATLLLAAGVAAQVQISLSRPHMSLDATISHDKRQIDAASLKRPIDLYSWYYPYAIDVTVGTPEQAQSLALTLTYSQSWVLNKTSCNTPDDPEYSYFYENCASGAYNASQSTTYTPHIIESSEYSYTSDEYQFYEVYASRYAAGSLMNETIHVGGAEVTSVLMGLVDETRLTTGFVGLGRSADPEDGSLLSRMTNQSIIASPAFSLWAEDQGNNVTGSILFGAVDKSKYEGQLSRVQGSAYRDMAYYYYSTAEWAVNVTAAEGDDGNSLVGSFNNFYATISPTTMITNLPLELAEPIWEKANASERYYWGGRAIDCNATIDGSITLELGGAGGYRLEVPLQDFVLPPETGFEMIPWEEDEEGESITWCFFGVQSTNYTSEFNHDSYDPWVIGNMALKDTYMVFDAENMEVGLAPLKSNPGSDSDIVTFAELGEKIPDSEFVGYEECFNSWGCYDDSDGGYGGYPDDDYEKLYNDYMRRVGIIIGVVIGVVLAVILGLSIWAILRCRRIRKADAEAASKGVVFGSSAEPSIVHLAVPPTDRMPVLPEEMPPPGVTTRQPAEDGAAQAVSPTSTPQVPEAALVKDTPATSSNQQEK